MFVDTIDWKIIGSCNLKCLHCYGPPKHQQHLPLGQLVGMIEKFGELGVKRVVLTGGEPLLVRGIDVVMASLAQHNISIALSTNTSFFSKNQDSIEKYVHSLNIPLDGPTPEIHALSRMESSSFYSCLEVLRHYRNNRLKKPALIRVGSVYSKATASTFLKIADLLEPFAEIISTWKIYELMEYEFQPELRAQIRPELGGFEKEMVELLTKAPFSSKIMTSPAISRDKAYFMVNPLGQLVLPTEVEGVTSEIVIGNFIEDSHEVLYGNWVRQIDMSKYKSNHDGHYIS